MPLKLVPPRQGKSPNWTIRGTHLGTRIDRTSGTADKRFAAKRLAQIQREIECGAFARPAEPTFAAAALKYLDSGGDDRFILKLAEYFGETQLSRINQAAIDEAAAALYPRASPATRNRQVYTPVSAVLKGAGCAAAIRRATPDQACRLLAAAATRDAEFGLFLAFLLYTGCRLSEALAITTSRVNLNEAWAYTQQAKNGEPRLLHLPPALVAALANHPRGVDRQGKLFRFGKNGRLYTWLDEAALAAGVEIPPRVAFHAFRHTWGAWMRRYGGLDTTGLVETGAWRSRQAAAVYEHANQSEEARRADLLPDVWKIRGNG